MYTSDIHCRYVGLHLYIHWGAHPYTLCCISCHTMYILLHVKCCPMYIHMSPNVYSIYIGYTHWVTFVYTLGCKPYTFCCIFCHTMYVEKSVTQCIYVKMHYDVYTQCTSNATQCVSHPIHSRRSTKRGIYIGLHFIYILLYFDIRCRCLLGNMY